MLAAEILSGLITGLFAVVSLQAAALRVDGDGLKVLYGKELTTGSLWREADARAERVLAAGWSLTAVGI
jgi:hypothetical protein